MFSVTIGKRLFEHFRSEDGEQHWLVDQREVPVHRYLEAIDAALKSSSPARRR